MIRVLIRAPSAVARAGLEALIRLDPLLHIVEDASDDSRRSRQPIEDREPDLIVVQIENSPESFAAISGFQHSLTEGAAEIPFVLLVPGNISGWSLAFRQGARAVLSSRASGQQIVAAIHAVAAGLAVFHPDESESFLENVIREVPGNVPEKLAEPLTPREIEVLRLMALGLGNKEIASRLKISEHTAKFHVASIMGKLGAENRTEAVMSGVQHGLVLI